MEGDLPAAGLTFYIPYAIAVLQPTTCGAPSGWVRYLVKSGESLFSLAGGTGSTIAAIKNANCLTSDTIKAGSYLWLPRYPYNTPVPTNPPAPTSPPPTVPPTSPPPTNPPTPEPTDGNISSETQTP
jgi:hypothetical protein